MFKTNANEQVKKVNKRLRQISEKGIALAAAETLNNMAFESKRISTVQFERDHVIRSAWTQRGMRFENARKGDPIRRMESRSGNIRDYAGKLETGGTITADNKFLPIPALGARISRSKRKRISKKFSMPRLSNVRRLPSVKGNASTKFAAMLNIARKEKYYGPFMITPGEAGSERVPRGIFMLNKAGRGKRGGGKITMIRKLHKTVVIKGHPFVRTAGVHIGKQMDRIYVKNAKRVLARFGRDVR